MTVLDIAIGLVVVAVLLWNQLRTRRVSGGRLILIPLVLVVLGVLQTREGLTRTSLGVLLLVLGLVLALILGAARGYAMKIWVGADGQFLRRGGTLLIALWLVSVAVKVGIDLGGAAAGARIAGSAILIELGVTLGAQNIIVAGRSYGWHRLREGLTGNRYT
jgi:hypothetical protein